MEIDRDLVVYLEKLGRIELSEEQREETQKDLKAILGYMDTLNELDTDGVLAQSHSFPVKNIFREDVVTSVQQVENILKNAPEKSDEYIIVPKTVD